MGWIDFQKFQQIFFYCKGFIYSAIYTSQLMKTTHFIKYVKRPSLIYDTSKL